MDRRSNLRVCGWERLGGRETRESIEFPMEYGGGDEEEGWSDLVKLHWRPKIIDLFGILIPTAARRRPAD